MSDPKSHSVITQGTIAEFMRKRTQLVGFSFGQFKHVQYVVEFLDNSLDAIESARWRYGAYNVENESINLQYTKTQKEDLFLDDSSDSESDLDSGAISGITETPEPLSDIENPPSTNDEVEYFLDASDQDIGITTLSLEALISPIRPNLNTEPIVIIRLQEVDIDSLASLTGTGAENERMYNFEIFDNGVGLIPEDLAKFGHYLASSKSEKLKQTRGSQGFGSPSAFSDAQNTTGKPITVLTKHHFEEQATVTVFYTTGKNVKQFIVEPNQVDVSFPHGTYIRLSYLNVPYRKGFVDTYIRRTSLLNAHITLIFIDPRGDVMVFNRRVNTFPPESSYALPHPTSVSIGDFTEIVRTSPLPSLASFFESSYSRISHTKANEIIRNAQNELNLRGTGLFTVDPQELTLEHADAIIQVLSDRPTCPYTIPFTSFKSILASQKPPRPILEVLTSTFADLSKPDARKILYKVDIDPEHLDPLSQAKSKRIHAELTGFKLCAADITIDLLSTLISTSKSTNIVNLLSQKFCSLTRSEAQDLLAAADAQLNYISLRLKKPNTLSESEIVTLFQEFERIHLSKLKITPDETGSISSVTKMTLPEFSQKIQTSSRLSIPAFLKNEFKLPTKKIQTILKDTEKQLNYHSLLTKLPAAYSEIEVQTLTILLQQQFRCSGSIPNKKKLLQILHNSPESSLKDWLENTLSIPHEESNVILAKISMILGLEERPLEMVRPKDLASAQINSLYRAFKAQKYFAPPTDTVVPVGSETMNQVIETTYNPEFVETETRKPTSGKGLAFVVEATIAYGGNIRDAKSSRQVLYRFVNRTTKLRDNSDCAIWKATASVNWKNYGIEQFDNGLPKGLIRIFVSVSGPFVHVMFKTQSKQALAEDETLLTEIKLALENVQIVLPGLLVVLSLISLMTIFHLKKKFVYALLKQ